MCHQLSQASALLKQQRIADAEQVLKDVLTPDFHSFSKNTGQNSDLTSVDKNRYLSNHDSTMHRSLIYLSKNQNTITNDQSLSNNLKLVDPLWQILEQFIQNKTVIPKSNFNLAQWIKDSKIDL